MTCHLAGICFRYSWIKSPSSKAGKQERLATKLNAVFEAEPLEDGIEHLAEKVIREALRSSEDRHILEWLRDISLDVARPSLDRFCVALGVRAARGLLHGTLASFVPVWLWRMWK